MADPVFLEELFLSLQGEGAEVGRPQFFLRLGGCPLRCRYCDTPESWTTRARFRVHAVGGCPVPAHPLPAGPLPPPFHDLAARLRPAPPAPRPAGHPRASPCP
nr:7-carboxy-7-deazaguanine synthase QueE [Planctomycetota bacterium]